MNDHLTIDLTRGETEALNGGVVSKAYWRSEVSTSPTIADASIHK